jgi:opine dehydrogenase
MQSKRIAILGGGHGAHAMAADFALKGHHVAMYETPEFAGRMKSVFDTGVIQASGEVNGTAHIELVTSDLDAAIAGADYICVVTPAFAHEAYAKALKGKARPDQVVVAFPGAFNALLTAHVFGDEPKPVLADVNNLPYDARLSEPGKVAVFGRNDVNVAFLPARAGDALIAEMRDELFPFVKVYNDVLESGLSIVNPAWHAGSCLFNISNIERPDINFFLYEHGWTPSATKLDIALDNERKAIGKVLDYHLRPMEDFSGMPDGYTWRQLYAAGHGSISLTPISGPNSIFDRFLTEDAPFGLVPWASIAEQLGVPMPLTNAVIDIYNVIHETDWRERGLTAADLGIEGMSAERLLEYVRTGV